MFLGVFLLMRLTEGVTGLSGHVCKRERAETYMTSYNQAFLCQERYTTSCGHLDWRRCTRYRVQTCYTPRERYAIKYHVIETCCPGWSDDGTGNCAIANCGGACQNEGTCSAVEGTPTCICQDGYYGDSCQHEKNHWEGWQTVVAASCGLLVVMVTAVTVYLYRRNRIKMKRINPVHGVQSPSPSGSGVTAAPSGFNPVHNIAQYGADFPRFPHHVIPASRSFPHVSAPQRIHPSAPLDCSDS
uniref:Multiple epidermal growth factor-like domains protein 11 n=1 Tax=Crassostrea virginica TaxID=6565 RepID=A0A8B8ALH7_CRAVI|nr:multiple epidermal growth factor-like domains protein 11 [Crassostrea virginica]